MSDAQEPVTMDTAARCSLKELLGMELLHANAYDSGARGIGADAGPICSSLAAVPT